MSSFMLTQMGVNTASAVGNFLVSRTEHKMDQAMTKYRNTMRALSAGESFNAINRNEVQVREQFAFATANDKIINMQDKEAARVAAAASGAYGNSVDTTLTGLARSAAQKKYAQERSLAASLTQLDDQRREVEMQKASGMEINVIPKPSVGLSMLGLTTNLLDTYRQHQPGSGNPNVRR